MGDVLQRRWVVTLDEFHAFRDERPKAEKWELIGGVPMMTPPPTLIHQRISGNLETLLNDRLASVQPHWQADRSIGVLLPDDPRFNPEPDVTVIDTAIEVGQLYAERFYFVAEVLSESNRSETFGGSDRPAPLAAKLAYYQVHEHCRGVLIVRQDRIEATLHTRSADGWHVATTLDTPGSRIVLPDIGDIGPLGALYRHTPLYAA